MPAPAASSLSSAPHDQALTSVQAIATAIGSVVAGKEQIIEHALIALLAGGHLLLEDIPGVGKSTLAKALAQAAGGEFHRIQFTSDLLPSDVLGVNVWRPQSERFEFRPGPLFANFVLADEINRAPPRTQSALLEAMGEGQISVDGQTRALPTPFMVIATQNPLEHYGTYPLPESQCDRFTLRLSMGYAAADVEAGLLCATERAGSKTLQPVTTLAAIATAQRKVREVFVHADLAAYAQRVVQATRDHNDVRLGVSTRGALSWVAAARARALLAKRDQLSIDDLQDLAVPALAHRLVVAQGGATQMISDEIIRDTIATTEVPT